MFSVELQISTRFEELVGGKMLDKFLRAFGKIFLSEWKKTSGSREYWAARSLTRLPERTRLTPRSGRLRRSVTQSGLENASRVQVVGASVTVTHGSRVPYAARQEYMKNGQRSFIRRSLKWLVSNRLDEFTNAALAKVWR